MFTVEKNTHFLLKLKVVKAEIQENVKAVKQNKIKQN